MSKSPTANAPQATTPAQLDDRDLDRVSGGAVKVPDAPQSIISPRDPAAYAGGPKLGIPLI